jgi:hypothetical protein
MGGKVLWFLALYLAGLAALGAVSLLIGAIAV